MRLLRQPQYAPFAHHQQVVILAAAMAHAMQDLPLGEMDRFRAGLTAYVEDQAPDLCRRVDQTGQLSQEDREEIVALSQKYREDFLKQRKRGG